MENFQLGNYGPENYNGNFAQVSDKVLVNLDDDYKDIFPVVDFYDFNGEFAYEDFEKMTGMSYLNYLRSHDDMI